MKGLFVEEKFKMYMKEFPEVTDKPDHAVVEIHMCGVCGTDVHSFSGNNANTVYAGNALPAARENITAAKI